MTFGFEAAEKLRRVEALLRDVLACELLACCQAWTLRDVPPAAGLGEYVRALSAAVAPVERDRLLGLDVAELARLLESGLFQ